MDSKRASYLFFGISAACVLLLVVNKAKGLTRMVNRLSFQIIPMFEGLNVNTRNWSLVIPFKLAVSNRRVNSPR